MRDQRWTSSPDTIEAVPATQTTQPPRLDGPSSQASFIETVENCIYFYSEIEREKVLQLNKRVRELSNDLPLKSRTLGLDEDIKIFLYINSYGGSIHAGLSAMDSIRSARSKVVTVVDGCCASAATFLSVVGHRRLINQNAHMMVHQLSSFMWGKYSEFEDEMANLKAMMVLIKRIYKEHTKLPTKKIDEILRHDIWLNAKQCLEYGMVDDIV